MHATSVGSPNMEALRSISDDVRNSDFRGHTFNLAEAIVTGEGPRNGARTEKRLTKYVPKISVYIKYYPSSIYLHWCENKVFALT